MLLLAHHPLSSVARGWWQYRLSDLPRAVLKARSCSSTSVVSAKRQCDAIRHQRLVPGAIA